MTMMSDISQDLVEEVLYRVPVTYMRAVRSTCKRWNDLSKDPSFTKKYGGKRNNEFLVILMDDFRACLMSINLHRIHDNENLVDPFIKQIGELNQVKISRVFHCDGLLLCLTNEDNTRLAVWNPYLAQTRWIPPINKLNKFDWYGMGYDNNNNNHKILRVFYRFGHIEYEIYNFMSNSWRVPNITTNWNMSQNRGSVSLKGNTYFIAQKKLEVEEHFEEVEMVEYFEDVMEESFEEAMQKHYKKEVMEECLLCFDFTYERFGQLLPLPFHFNIQNSVNLSIVREEQLAVLFKRCDAYETKIWITTKIEPNAVSWSYFLKLDFKFDILGGNFFIGEEEKVAVICSTDGGKSINNTAHMIGEDGYYKEVDLGEAKCCPCMCSYVPSCVQI